MSNLLYRKSLIRFISHRSNKKYPDGHEFFSKQLAAISPRILQRGSTRLLLARPHQAMAIPQRSPKKGRLQTTKRGSPSSLQTSHCGMKAPNAATQQRATLFGYCWKKVLAWSPAMKMVTCLCPTLVCWCALLVLLDCAGTRLETNAVRSLPIIGTWPLCHFRPRIDQLNLWGDEDP